jgi:hypothetical protein
MAAADAQALVFVLGVSSGFLPAPFTLGQRARDLVPLVAKDYSLKLGSITLRKTNEEDAVEVENKRKTIDEAFGSATELLFSTVLENNTYIIAKGTPEGKFIPRTNPHFSPVVRSLFVHRRLVSSFCSSLFPFFAAAAGAGGAEAARAGLRAGGRERV